MNIRSVWLLAAAAALLVPLRAPAEEAAAEGDEAQAISLLSALRADGDEASAGASRRGRDIGVDLQPWKHGPRPGLWVGAGLFQEQDLRVGVFERRGGKLALVAGAVVDSPDGIDPPWHGQVSLDLIRFELRPGECAFGVRYANSYSSTSRGAASEALYLYRLAGRKLELAFEALTSWERNDDTADPHSRTEKKSYVVIISSALHGGYYDLILKEKRTKATRTFVWNGKSYAEAK
jgi:hypothetical protein